MKCICESTGGSDMKYLFFAIGLTLNSTFVSAADLEIHDVEKSCIEQLRKPQASINFQMGILKVPMTLQKYGAFLSKRYHELVYNNSIQYKESDIEVTDVRFGFSLTGPADLFTLNEGQSPDWNVVKKKIYKSHALVNLKNKVSGHTFLTSIEMGEFDLVKRTTPRSDISTLTWMNYLIKNSNKGVECKFHVEKLYYLDVTHN